MAGVIMGDLTRNLSRSEFTCECGCGFDTVDVGLIFPLQECVDFFEDKYDCTVMIIISGGNRCQRHNTRERDLFKQTNGVQGSNTALDSQHIYARAADIKLYRRMTNGVKGLQVEPEEVALFFEEKYPDFGIGRYRNRTHVDNRTNGPARWDMR